MVLPSSRNTPLVGDDADEEEGQAWGGRGYLADLPTSCQFRFEQKNALKK